MDCREFRKKHVAFVDDLLPAIEMRAMQQHRIVCPRCSRHDTAIRRSLLLVRNLRPIEPSKDFTARLNARLQQLDAVPDTAFMPARSHLPSLGAFAALAAGIAATAYLTMAASTHHTASPNILARSTAVPETPGMPMANAAFVASVPIGMPIWPGALMVGQAPAQFARLEFHPDRAH